MLLPRASAPLSPRTGCRLASAFCTLIFPFAAAKFATMHSPRTEGDATRAAPAYRAETDPRHDDTTVSAHAFQVWRALACTRQPVCAVVCRLCLRNCLRKAWRRTRLSPGCKAPVSRRLDFTRYLEKKKVMQEKTTPAAAEPLASQGLGIFGKRGHQLQSADLSWRETAGAARPLAHSAGGVVALLLRAAAGVSVGGLRTRT